MLPLALASPLLFIVAFPVVLPMLVFVEAKFDERTGSAATRLRGLQVFCPADSVSAARLVSMEVYGAYIAR